MTEVTDAADRVDAPPPKPNPSQRAHLVERAAAMMGGIAGLQVPRPPVAVPAPTSLEPAVAGPDAFAADLVAQSFPRAIPEGAPEQGIPDVIGPGSRRQAATRPALPDAAAASAAQPEAPITLDLLQRVGLSVAPAAGRSRVSEEVGVVQHQVLRSLEAPKFADRRGRVVLVTSARPGEGKSFTALNVAAALAYSGRQVVLVDADAKRDALGAALGCADGPGLRALAEDPIRKPFEFFLRTAVPRMLLLPYGGTPDRAGSLPAGAALAGAVLRVADAMPGAVVVVDATPCLSTSEPGTLASVAGQVLLVVEAERTQRNEVEAALDMVDACPTLQLVLNKARLTANDTFGAYYGS